MTFCLLASSLVNAAHLTLLTLSETLYTLLLPLENGIALSPEFSFERFTIQSPFASMEFGREGGGGVLSLAAFLTS